jgi:cobalamin biosynthesis Mg chelatase CobN
MLISDGLMIVSVLLAPFLAIFAQRKLDEAKERRGQKLWIFRTLMATRGNKLSLEHVQALNSIDLFFVKRRKEKRIVEKWEEYLDHLNTATKEDDPDYRVKLTTWSNEADEILAELLSFMGQCLGYDFDKVRIKKGIYMPKGHGDFELENTIIRRSMVEIMLGKKGFPVAPYGKTHDGAENV